MPGQVRLINREVPRPGFGQLLVRVRCATTCGTDLKAYLRGHPQIPMPGPFGHEYAGDVAEVGDGVEQFSLGDSIMGVHSAPCGECHWCSRGQENLCPTVMGEKVLGSFSEFLLLPAHIVKRNLYHRPDWVGFSRAALLEPLACVANAILRIRPRCDDRVLLVGSGPIAILFRAAFHHLGGKNVWLLSRRNERAEYLNSLGVAACPPDDVSKLVEKETEGRGFDLVVECAGNVDAWKSATRLVRRGGTVVLFGGCPSGSKFEIDPGRLHYDDLTIVSPFHFGTAAVAKAREWLTDPSFDPGPLVTSEAPLEEVGSVFEDLKRGNGLKVALIP